MPLNSMLIPTSTPITHVAFAGRTAIANVSPSSPATGFSRM